MDRWMGDRYRKGWMGWGREEVKMGGKAGEVRADLI